MGIADVWSLCRATYEEWSKDKASRLAAALAFYAIFSLAPLLILTITFAALFYGDDAARGLIATQIEKYVGRAGAEVIQGILRSSARQPPGLAAAIGFGTLLMGGIGIFNQLQDALNTIWGVETEPFESVWQMIRLRAGALLEVLGVCAMFLAMLIVSTILSAAGQFAGSALPEFSYGWHLLDVGGSFSVMFILFAFAFKKLPEATVEWRDVWQGAGITALLFSAGKSLIGIYLGRSSVGSAYGAAGSLVALLVWIYYSAQIMLFGAEFTKVCARKRGAHVLPKEHARALTAESRAEQGMSPGPH